jgi:hypothetical protein
LSRSVTVVRAGVKPEQSLKDAPPRQIRCVILDRTRSTDEASKLPCLLTQILDKAGFPKPCLGLDQYHATFALLDEPVDTVTDQAPLRNATDNTGRSPRRTLHHIQRRMNNYRFGETTQAEGRQCGKLPMRRLSCFVVAEDVTSIGTGNF